MPTDEDLLESCIQSGETWPQIILIVGRALNVPGVSVTQTLFHPYHSSADFLFVLEVSPFCVYGVVMADRIQVSLVGPKK